ncbi:MAG: ABC transporter ATP-binding protein [Xanthomonadales bacterium]|nr:ABC transporter ATP-binding protein [Xanthomonadales bacterium]
MKFTRLLQYITPHRVTLLLVLVLLVGDSLAALTQPWIAGKLASAALDGGGGNDFVRIQQVLLLWLGLITVKSILGFFSSYLIGNTGERMAARLRKRVYEHIQVLPIAYFQTHRRGESLSLLSNDALVISNFVTTTLVSMLPLLLTFFGAFYIMTRLDLQIALVAVLLLPVYYIAMKLIGLKIRPIATDWVQAWTRMVSFVEENLGLLPVIKSFGREKVETQRFDSRNKELLILSKRQILVQSILAPAISFLAAAGLLLLLWLGIKHVVIHEITPGALVSLLLYAMLMTRPISGLANVYGEVQRARGAAERLVDFFSEQPEPPESGLPTLDQVKGHIRFERVSFAYPGRVPLLRDMDFEIKAGETIALTGLNGSGKSTLAYLLMRFIQPTSGRVTIDGKDISKYSLESIRHSIGLVAQHTLLLNGSVAENIAYGRYEASKEDIERAARASGAHEFIIELPDGYDTTIGDQGIRLSGGQRQKLSLARTLLTDPPILILDEATAMFDPQGEEDFIDGCSDLLEQRTVILITHRPVTVALANRVVKMQDARVVPGAHF